mgnify:CR=1 FL=1
MREVVGKNINLDYTSLLDRAMNQVPKHRVEQSRFKVPKAEVSIVGSRTIIHNFKELTNTLRREPRHLLRFILKQLATAGDIEGDLVILQGQFSRATINRLIDLYVRNYVICPVCKAPDTKIVKEKRMWFLICEACGAKSSIRPF